MEIHPKPIYFATRAQLPCGMKLWKLGSFGKAWHRPQLESPNSASESSSMSSGMLAMWRIFKTRTMTFVKAATLRLESSGPTPAHPIYRNIRLAATLVKTLF